MEKSINKPPKLWFGIGCILSSIALLLIMWLGQPPSSSPLEFYVPVILALMPVVFGIYEIIRYLRDRRDKKAIRA